MQLGMDSRSAERLAIGLGWFSVALGLTEIVAPRHFARTIGMPEASETTIRSFGAREVGNGLAILVRPDRAGWLWSRVGGDALDLSYLASGLRFDHNHGGRLGMAIAAVLGVTALDVVCARQLSEPDDDFGSLPTGIIRSERSITINRPLDEVYRFWKHFENFPRFMRRVQSVEMLSGNRSRWRVSAPAGMTVEWEAEMVADREGERIAWRSTPDSDMQNSGIVQFKVAPGARGTDVRVQLEYLPPAGRLGRSIAWLFGDDPDQTLDDDLRRFKNLMESKQDDDLEVLSAPNRLPCQGASAPWHLSDVPDRIRSGGTFQIIAPIVGGQRLSAAGC
ncbi:hypothetical protein BH18ACI5_BH18ACI5_17550 [soil metagenome]